MRALGIDPGTRSFDIAVIEGGRVVWEESIDTVTVAERPEALVEAVEAAGHVDIISGPSGYGVPVTFNHEIIDPYRFALEVLLLTREDDLRRGIELGELGIHVYRALTEVVVELHRRGLPVCYIPSCILLPTVPKHRKVNKLDMGTADKMATAVLGVIDQSERSSIDPEEASFILVELGFGYNAAVAVEKGRIIDGLGGTLGYAGFLTMGSVDGEIAVMGREWARSDVFHGGVADICGAQSMDEALRRYDQGEEPYVLALNAMLEGIERSVRGMTTSIRNPEEIILSGRYSRNQGFRKLIEERLARIGPVRNLGMLRGAEASKEAAQGYAVVADGIAGGEFSGLIRHMRIGEASGTVMSWVYHPRLREAKERLLRAYVESVKNPKL
ncbi:MAG: butyrate kinase [Candidatus Bathyarchaeota archaeon B63]|nr:MAG: butyrate kinase [Candidatus Bathyarchaeota archaeon B63]